MKLGVNSSKMKMEVIYMDSLDFMVVRGFYEIRYDYNFRDSIRYLMGREYSEGLR